MEKHISDANIECSGHQLNICIKDIHCNATPSVQPSLSATTQIIMCFCVSSVACSQLQLCSLMQHRAVLSEALSTDLTWSCSTWGRRESRGNEKVVKPSQTHPKVLINPLVEPSAYREHMSPIWRKLDILSDMIAQGWLHLQKIDNTGH